MQFLPSQNEDMFKQSLTTEQQRELATNLTSFLSQYRHLSDSYIIEFFTEDLWQTLPSSWQSALKHLSFPQIADLLLDSTCQDRRYPSVWPLSLLAFRATAHALAVSQGRQPQRDPSFGTGKPEEFHENQSQSSLLGHIFRKHVKPKKQHEIRKLGTLVKRICDETGCDQVVDVGSGQGHLTRFLSYGLGLSVTAIEADQHLVSMATVFDKQLLWALDKEKQKRNCTFLIPDSHPRHVAGWVDPNSSWRDFLKQLQSSSPCASQSPPTFGPRKKKLKASKHETKLQDVESNPQLKEITQECLTKNELSSLNCCQQTQNVYEESVCNNQESFSDFVLTGLHACGDLSATLLRHFVKCPHVRGITSVACCYMKITTKENPTPPGLVQCPCPTSLTRHHSELGYPMSCWVGGLPGHQLSYKAREGSCHAIEDYMRRLREGSELLRTHCYRAMLESFIRDVRPDLKRAGIQTIKKAHMLQFTEYAGLGLARVGLPSDLPLDPARVEAMLEHQGRVVVFFSLALLLAPVVESLVLLDRIIYLQENGVDSQLVPLFNPNFSPRNFVLVALKQHR
ncbi:LOW QUALITY PROTEIN: protein RRNAD1 [Boleophthalmus pectinirostris]|uniref:LOW QUALITY PROTEIN: protein RRNAD1 n=1 Tax=Boleophthalmus pectinirostris TaxID=150288 RepID=UPI00242E55E7|nr:LOW QUALITY PROTEIN: protein RRNAD1 [Boleophthalmus pectinirostris]